MPVYSDFLDNYMRLYGAPDADRIFSQSPLFDRLSQAPSTAATTAYSPSTTTATIAGVQVVADPYALTGYVYMVTQSSVLDVAAFLRDGASAAFHLPFDPAQPQSSREKPPESKPPLEFPIDRKIRFTDG